MVQPRRPGNGEFDRYSPGQGVGGLDENTAARYVYGPANSCYHLTLADDDPVFECDFDRVATVQTPIIQVLPRERCHREKGILKSMYPNGGNNCEVSHGFARGVK